MLNNVFVDVFKTTQGPLGNIWMVSGSRIILYDGYNYNLIKGKTIFPKIKKNDGIKDITRDSHDNVWITTTFGLITKYDANTGQFIDITASLLNDDAINTIVAKADCVWFASKNGNIYRYSENQTTHITTLIYENSALNTIHDIEIGNSGHLFISTQGGKIFSYTLKTKQFTELISEFTDFPGYLILSTDKKNRLWVGTETYGLYVYDIFTKKFIQDSFFKKNKYNIHKEMFLTLFNDSNGYMWGGTDGGGLYKINTENGHIEIYTKQDVNSFSLSSNTVLNISEDNHKNIWISTNYGNLNVLPNSNNKINYHEGSENNSPLRILSIHKSSDDVLWVGTDGRGLTKITHNTDGSTNETQYFNDIAFNKGFYVQSITEDEHSNLWFGTYKNGLWNYNKQQDRFSKINIYNTRNQQATDVRTVFTDSKGRIWAGSNLSITVYSPDLKLLATFKNKYNGLKGSILESIIEDHQGEIWLGIYEGGLFQFNENKTDLNQSSFTNYSFKSKNKSNEVQTVKSISLGDPGELWLIYGSGTLHKFHTANKSFDNLDAIKPIKGLHFASVIVENSDHLWMSSFNGLYHLDLKESTLKTFYTSDGLQDNMFLTRSAFKDDKGILYFGGINGLNYFHPKDLTKKTSLASLNINTIEILNQPAASLIPDQIPSGISKVDALQLKYGQSSFSFRFSAIDNILSPKYYYAYRLKGFNNDWITGGSERIATYTNIPSNSYTFEVRAGTKKGVWDIPVKKIAIIIEQPIWNKPIAYLIYLSLIGLVAYGLRRWYLLRKKLLFEKISHKNENELHELKMNFFAKMSHEIQTPITLILGPIEDMLKRSEQNGNLLLKQRLNIISYNTKRLSKIARELTLVRNKELDRLKLSITKNNLFKDIENISLSFKELARKKQIDFAINCPKNLSEAWYDREKIEHSLYNLLSNAFKFTPKEGNIQLTVIPIDSKRSIKLSVIDSGPGIPEAELNTIFELFYQSNIGKKNKGTGIGLALTKDLIDLHRGSIKVSSTPVEGTNFTMILPISEEAYTESERIMTSEYLEPSIIPINKNDEQTEDKIIDHSKKTVLIVEDNYDLQGFIKELLSHDYNVLLADNGEEGYHYAKSNFPDLILSDIMMPVLNGIEMCKKLQKNPLTQHIPIILLTAKNSTNSKISGLRSGAIEYINKPFNTNELLLKIKNIILSKEHIISKYRKEVISRPEVKMEKSQDEIFLEELVSNINSRLEDANFKMEELADSLHMGYSSLYRKCQSLTGHSLVDFVRILRLKKAAVLMTKYGYNISETSFMTGFNDPKYFSKCFKKHFSKTPKDFKKEAQEIGVSDYLKEHQLNDNL